MFNNLQYFFIFCSLENKEFTDLILTYKNIDKRTFFAIPMHFKNIDDIIKELDKPNELKWPCGFEKEVDTCPS